MTLPRAAAYSAGVCHKPVRSLLPIFPCLRVFTRLLIGIVAVTAVASAAPRRVVILTPFSRDTEPFTAAVSSFRITLAAEIGEPLDLHEIPLDLAHFTDPDGELPLVGLLETRLAQKPADLVVAVGGAAVQFAHRHRERLFPDTQVLVLAAAPRMVPDGFLDRNATLVTEPINLPGMVEDILRMQPDTRQVAVVFGSSPLEKLWAAECRREFARFEPRVDFLWLDGLTLEETLGRCSRLPRNAFILHGLFLEDATGVPCEKNLALRKLHETANAPVFGYFASELGEGPVGGHLFQNGALGAQGARMAARILKGEQAEAVEPVILETAAPEYDWRELRRWNIAESNLPANAIIRYRQPGFWQRYGWSVAGVGTFALLQTGLIVALLVNRSKRRESESAATLIADISTHFAHLPTPRIDEAIVDAQERICGLLGLDSVVLWQNQAENSADFVATHAYRGDQEPGALPPFRQEDFPWVRSELAAGRMVVVRKLDDLPQQAWQDRQSAEAMGIRSSLTLPLVVGGDDLMGAIGFNDGRGSRRWSGPLVQRLQLVAGLFANALARQKASQELRDSQNQERLAMEQAFELRETLAHAGRVTLLGQLASSLAHELSQPLGAILRNAEAAEILLGEAAPDIEEMKAIVEDILRDDRRAGEVINKLRSLLEKEPSTSSR